MRIERNEIQRVHEPVDCRVVRQRPRTRHAFRFVRSVIFLIGPRNLRSQKAIEKIGARLAESRVDKKGIEHLVYRIERSDELDAPA